MRIAPFPHHPAPRAPVTVHAAVRPCHLLRPLAVALMGASLLGSAQAQDPIKWQKPGLEITPRLALEWDSLRNRQLRSSNQRNQSELEASARLTSRWQRDERWGVVGEAELSGSIERDTGTPTDHQTHLDIKQLYGEAQLQEMGARVRLGRWSYADERTWFFDDDFDGLNAAFEQDFWHVEAIAARKGQWRRDLFNRHTDHQRGSKVLGAFGTLYLGNAHQLILKGLHQNDSTNDLRLNHLVAGSLDQPGEGMQHWIIGSFVNGREKGRRINGYAFDVGGTWFLDSNSQWNPRASVGYAWGSGDDGGGSDGSHRQTGMQTNKAYMGGVMDFKTYGTVLDPQLSNIHVLTAGFGITPMKKSSVDLVLHHYRQDKVAALTRTDLRPRADNQSSHALGHGIDVVWGWRPSRAWKMEATAGVFLPGSRFRSGTSATAGKASKAWAASFEVKYYPGRK